MNAQCPGNVATNDINVEWPSKRNIFYAQKFFKTDNAAVWRFHDAVASDAATRPPSTPNGQEVMPVLMEFSGLNFLFETPVNGEMRLFFITYYEPLIPYMNPSENV